MSRQAGEGPAAARRWLACTCACRHPARACTLPHAAAAPPHPHCRSAYKTLNTIDTASEDAPLNKGLLLKLAPAQSGNGDSLTVTDGTTNCASAASRVTIAADDSCPAGTSRDDNPQVDANNAAAVYAPKQCAPCEPGMTCAANNKNEAKKCLVGSANPLVGGTTCEACTAGTAAVTEGAPKCQECGAGTTPTQAHDQCVLCGAGTFSANPGGVCEACPANTARGAEDGDGTTCAQCPPGTQAAADGKSCTPCTKGYFNDIEGGTCREW